MDQSERSEGHQFNIASLPGTTNGDKLYDFLRGSLIPSMHPFTVHFDRGHSCSGTGSPFEGSMHIYMYSGDGLVFDYQMALPQTDHASHNFKSVRCFERWSVIHSICDPLSENPALPANIEFELEAIISV